MVSIYLAQDWVKFWVHVNAVMNLWVPSEAGNFLSGLANISLITKDEKEKIYQSVNEELQTLKMEVILW